MRRLFITILGILIIIIAFSANEKEKKFSIDSRIPTATVTPTPTPTPTPSPTPPAFPVTYSLQVVGMSSSSYVFTIGTSTGPSYNFTLDVDGLNYKYYGSYFSFNLSTFEYFILKKTGTQHLMTIIADDGITKSVQTSTFVF